MNIMINSIFGRVGILCFKNWHIKGTLTRKMWVLVRRSEHQVDGPLTNTFKNFLIFLWELCLFHCSPPRSKMRCPDRWNIGFAEGHRGSGTANFCAFFGAAWPLIKIGTARDGPQQEGHEKIRPAPVVYSGEQRIYCSLHLCDNIEFSKNLNF
jgi:hypothetical protein